ncbi:MAG: HPr family phosphocarrier protein [Clostridia bacterium]|nr:HPr family phosphocarrier protein [Clostridia bacterium]MBQ6990891.1 HPr family phosphocarrier protein [Clostridia bacterium]
MKDMIVKLNSINDVKDFVNLSVASPCEIYLISGRYIVDGKSIMGVFSLDLANNIRVEAHGDAADAYYESIKRFVVEA